MTETNDWSLRLVRLRPHIYRPPSHAVQCSANPNLVQIGGGRVDRLIRRGAKRVTDRGQLGHLCPILEVDLSCAHQDERFGVEGKDI